MSLAGKAACCCDRRSGAWRQTESAHYQQRVIVMPPSFALVMQTDGLLPSASDFMTSGDESGGGKSGAQRKRSFKDKPRKSRMKKEEDADVETASPGMLHAYYCYYVIPFCIYLHIYYFADIILEQVHPTNLLSSRNAYRKLI